ncbi:nucleotidyltransferase domain-containing protein [Acidovorax sp. Root70]|uniref:nucleotidyltransferase domain-containing protein n=1 Tax=Acidovorax sp. Root70 TaxID=1736590 RepID=UPI0009ECC33A|nr:nucleotidyltransferase domain-containing protein [Acidovorax sp. Root70]
MAAISYSAPLADPGTLAFAVNFCIQVLGGYGIKSIYLIGSRANGQPRSNSDHDILVILDDAAPADISLSGTLHSKIFLQLDKARKAQGLGPIDLITMRESRYQNSKDDPSAFAGAVSGGIRLF